MTGETASSTSPAPTFGGLLKVSSLLAAHGQPGEPFEPSPPLVRLGFDVGYALGIEVFGVDVLIGPAGPSVVDVNAFPGFRGVADADLLLACHVAGVASGLEPLPCTCDEPPVDAS